MWVIYSDWSAFWTSKNIELAAFDADEVYEKPNIASDALRQYTSYGYPYAYMVWVEDKI